MNNHIQPNNNMTHQPHTEPPESHSPETATEKITREAADMAKETAKRAADSAKEAADSVAGTATVFADATQDAVGGMTDSAKNICRSAALKTEEVLDTSREYVRLNPVPALLGAITLGAALGCLVMMARRKPTFGERYADEPVDAVRDAIFGAFSPVTKRVHHGYDAARTGAGKAMDRAHRFGKGPNCHSITDQFARFGNNLKFW